MLSFAYLMFKKFFTSAPNMNFSIHDYEPNQILNILVIFQTSKVILLIAKFTL